MPFSYSLFARSNNVGDAVGRSKIVSEVLIQFVCKEVLVMPHTKPGVEFWNVRVLSPELISEALSVKESPELKALLGPLDRNPREMPLSRTSTSSIKSMS